MLGGCLARGKGCRRPCCSLKPPGDAQRYALPGCGRSSWPAPSLAKNSSCTRRPPPSAAASAGLRVRASGEDVASEASRAGRTSSAGHRHDGRPPGAAGWAGSAGRVAHRHALPFLRARFQTAMRWVLPQAEASHSADGWCLMRAFAGVKWCASADTKRGSVRTAPHCEARRLRGGCGSAAPAATIR